MVVVADASRLASTGFTPSRGLADGLAEVVRWWSTTR
jgi:hypothetical protein